MITGIKHAERIITDLFSSANVAINGNHPWDIQVRDPRFFSRLITDAELGFGESYMDGWWECEALDECVNRALSEHIEKQLIGWKSAARIALSKILNFQKKSRSFEVGEKHYDLGNDLYQAMLDKRLNYTCAYWKGAADLDQAQEAKLDLVCKKIGIHDGMKILELGCGWGSFAKYAAEKYGALVTGVTVSKQQVTLGRQLCKGLPVELRLQDYREVEGQYDAVISIGIMEHVGYKNYRGYMKIVDRCLKKHGIAFIHTIGRNDSATNTNAWIHKYIFPNSMLPSVSQIAQAMEGLFMMEDMHSFGPHYDRTLMAWYANFERAWPKLKDRYGDRFYRMWRFYLLSCAGSFRARSNQLWQFVMTRNGTFQPECRFS
ncbi:cyclopropane fatty acyl phospholipid synthase [bacterium]|nr:MAG: cyclopropane fatty acyl phospholipid synthase [bacterium]